MKKQVISMLLTIVLIFALKITSNAASAEIQCKDSATVGEEITINTTVTGVMWNLELKVNGETIAKNNELENYESNKTVKFSGKYIPKTEGNLNVTLVGTVTEFSDGSTVREFGAKTITVKAPVVEIPKEPETPVTNSGSTTTTPEAKSSEARLKTFGITPNEYDFSGFSKNRDKENWAVTVPNSATEVTVYGTVLGKKATIQGTGKVSLKEGTNEVKVTVTAEAGNTKTYILTITRRTAAEEEKENSEAGLKMLGIKPEQYDFKGFKSDKTEYSVEVPNEIEQIEIYATVINSKAQITGTGMVDIKEGENELPVEVIAVDGTKKTYTLKVTRKEAEQTEDEENEEVIPTTDGLGLSTLAVTGLTISPKFKSDVYEYTIGVREDLTSLDINAKANDDDATVEIIGNENLQQGENIITILLKNDETEEAATYQIIVNKNVVIEEKTSWLQPSTWGKEEKIKIAIVVVLIILIIIAIILKIKISNEEQEDDRLNLPGADELDKAIAEHQELSEFAGEEQDVIENIKLTSNENNNYDEINSNYIEEIARNKFTKNNEANDSFEEEAVSKPKGKGRHF